MPTYERTDRFRRDHAALSPEEKAAFRTAVEQFIEDLPSQRFRKGLRVKGVRGTKGIFEMTWGDDGRATFEYGPEIMEGEPHIIWRRCGTHAIFGAP